jgi:biopolymer transport protein TolR
MQLGNGEGQDGARQAGATYRRLRGRAGLSAMGDINITPLVDVVLVLLLVFMVTAPMMSRGIDVSLPVADQPDTSREDRVTITVSADERVYVGDRPVNLVRLEDYLRGLRESGRPMRVVYLSADERLRYGKVVEVVDRIKKAGVEIIGFVYVLPQEKTKP